MGQSSAPDGASGVGTAGRRSVTSDDDLLRFATVWAPFGGGEPDQIFVTFGLSVVDYYQRLVAAVRAAPQMDPQLRQQLLKPPTRPA